MDAEAVRKSVTLDPQWANELKQAWLALMELTVWGDVKSTRLGAMGKLRKKTLDLGEKLKSLAADREWIPHPRERVKNALGSSFNLRDSLLQLERAAKDVDGGSELASFSQLMIRLHTLIVPPLEILENQWATLLDSQYQDEDQEEDQE
ncbi:hypothetical protein [Sulfurirhabdus autotrophica]|uniref:Uncharacterized protein n=1 Tax=Sulfurirhabdus autotrophica TaxID=1706046 RepID=A0A4R3Y3J8_9PROT|nr:hypothetical protein [Sulfurirhabdus autotrophica]TCV84693.1 hypothetical protein EDC63_11137 [Sulfurirhabdus autotrophica]